MRALNKSHVLGALTAAAAVFLSIPAWAQSTVVVQGIYKVSGDSTNGTSVFTKAQGAEKTSSIGNTKFEAVLTALSNQGPAPAADISFVLVGQPTSPNGGLLVRFPGAALPGIVDSLKTATSTKLTFYGATPYTLEYDGFADFPRYPLTFLSEANSLTGIFFVHLEDFGIPPSAEINKIDVKFSLKKPGKIKVGDAAITLPGKTVIMQNKIDLSGNR